MNLLHLFLGFFIANLLGYGGGPASIPLMQNQIVNHYHWMTNAKFANVLALGNSLPGPLATKVATYLGFQVYGWLGVVVALVATVAPSAVGLLVLSRLLAKHRQSRIIRGMTLLVQPVIAVMMLLLTIQMGQDAVSSIGFLQSAIIAAVAFFALVKFKVHPAFVIVAAFAYGGLVLPHLN